MYCRVLREDVIEKWQRRLVVPALVGKKLRSIVLVLRTCRRARHRPSASPEEARRKLSVSAHLLSRPRPGASITANMVKLQSLLRHDVESG